MCGESTVTEEDSLLLFGIEGLQLSKEPFI